MRFLPCALAIFAVCAATVSGVRAEDAPDVKFKQTGKLNIGLAITKTEEKGRIRAEQDGRENLFLSDQGWISNGPFQFSDEDLPLNKLNLYQMGEKSLAVSRQRGLMARASKTNQGDQVLQSHGEESRGFVRGGCLWLQRTGLKTQKSMPGTHLNGFDRKAVLFL